MRRWDGSRWTGESRALPPWAPAGAGGTATRRRRGRHWTLLAAVTAFLFLGVTWRAFSGVKTPARTVFDRAFIGQANDACRADIAALKAERPKPGTKEGKEPGDHATVAAKVDDVADRLHTVAARLRSVPVVPDDRADVAAWLDEWDRYTDLGHQYADAVREDAPRQTQLAEDGARAEQRITLFAQANKLNDCAFS
jgi:hypothetical protein